MARSVLSIAMPFIVVALALVVAYLVVTRAQEIFCLSVRDGRTLLVRGRLPVSVQQDLEDVVARSGVGQATIRAVRAEGHARLVVSGGDAGLAQRCRNVFGVHPIHQLRATPADRRHRNLGQLLGIASLAWLLARE